MRRGKGKSAGRKEIEGLSDRDLYDALRANQHPDMARMLNPIVAKSRKDRLGAIVLREQSGPDNTSALRVAKEFEERAGGLEGVAAKIEAIEPDQRPEGVKDLPAILRDPKNAGKHLYRVLAEQQVSLLTVMKTYAKGAVELAQVEAAIEAHRGMPAIVKDLVRNALDRTGVCSVCLGVGLVRNKSTDHKETLMCPVCEGTGTRIVSSPHKEFAAKTVLEMTKQIGQTPGTQVNVAVGINMAGGKSYAERMIDAADKVLYGRDVVDAEVTKPKELPECSTSE